MNIFLVTVDLNALSSSKLRILLPVLPSGDDSSSKSNDDKADSKHLLSTINSSNTEEQSTDDHSPISANDSVYGYKSIVLKKITEEGLKDLLKNGSKSKATATITYKVIYLHNYTKSKKDFTYFADATSYDLNV